MSRLSRFTIFLLVFSFGLCVYLPLLSRNYDLNGMAEAAGLNSGRPVDLFLPNHLLYRPIGYAVQQALAIAGLDVSAVTVLQVLSAVFGALGIGFTYLLLERLVENRTIAVWLSLLLGVSWSYWTMSTDIYYLSLSAMFVAAATAVFVSAKSDAAFALCGALVALAILSFQANVFLLPGLSVALLFGPISSDTRITFRRLLLMWGTSAAIVAVAFISVGILVYERKSPLDLIQWGSSYTGKALPMWGSFAAGRFLTVIGTGFKSVVGLEFWMFEFFQSRLKNGEVPGWIPFLGAIALAIGLIAAYRWGPEKRPHENRLAAWLLVLYAIYIPFFLWWDATEPRWFNLTNIFLAGLAAIIASRWSGWPYFKFVLPAGFLILAGLNFATSAGPRRFAPSTPVRMAACVADQMKEGDLFLATEWNWAGYLEYIHDREVLSFLVEVARTGDKSIASQGISQAAKERQRQGGTVYMIDVRSFPPDYMKWFTEQTKLTESELLEFRGSKSFDCVFSAFIRLDPL